MKNSKNFKTVAIILCIAAAIVLAYAAQGIYFSYTGKVETEYIFETDDKQVVSVNGFVVRDENRTENKKNISILEKTEGRTYVPVVSDSASVAKGQTIAISFENEQDAKAYNESLLLEEKIDHLTQLQNQGSVSHINVMTLNSEISSAVNDYMKIIESGDYSNLDEAAQSISYKITTRQLATGTKLDFSPLISDYIKQKKALLKTISGRKNVNTEYAGYFVSTVDGLESAANYSDIAEGKIDSAGVEKLLSAEGGKTENAFGKIIGQHTWYFVCNLPLSEASVVKTGYYVDVSFPDKGINNLSMSVQSVSSRAGETIAVVLKCTSMNREISALRKEKAQITVKTYSGLRISNEALTSDEAGTEGVYTLSGKRVSFKPLNIIHYGDNYVIATAVTYYNEDGSVDYKKTSENEIKAFDQVITKGRNLSDGKVIG